MQQICGVTISGLLETFLQFWVVHRLLGILLFRYFLTIVDQSFGMEAVFLYVFGYSQFCLVNLLAMGTNVSCLSMNLRSVFFQFNLAHMAQRIVYICISGIASLHASGAPRSDKSEPICLPSVEFLSHSSFFFTQNSILFSSQVC